MSSILTQWLRNDIGFADKFNASELEREFANGFRFGQLLESLGLVDDFDAHFVRGSSSEAIIKNYTSLETTLREKLRYRLTSSMALSLIRAKAGSAAKILFHIKTIADTLPKKRKIIKSTANPRIVVFDSPAVDGESTTTAKKSTQEAVAALADNEVERFSALLKQKLKKTSIDAAIRRPVKQSIPQLPAKSRKQLPALPKVIPPSRENERASPNGPSVNFTISSLDDNAESEDELDIAVPRRTEVFYPSMIPPISFESKGRIDIQNHHDPLDDFEEKSGNNSIHPELVSHFLHNTAKLDSSSHMTALKTVIRNSNALDNEETKHYLDKIKIHRREVEIARLEREQKRKKNALMRRKAEEEMEKRVMDDILMNKILLQSKQERLITEELLKKRSEKEAAWKRRLELEESYNITRQKEYEETIEMEHQRYLNAQTKYRNQIGMQIEKHMEIMDAKKRLMHDRDLNWIHENITMDIVKLALKSIEYKKQNDKNEVPLKKIREWKHSQLMARIKSENHEFVSEKLHSKPIVFNENVQKSEVPPLIKMLDANELIDYINYAGSWDMCGNGSIKNHDALANLIDQLILATAKPDENIQEIPVPLVPLRIALIGKKYSGKKSAAQYLAKLYNMSIIDVDELTRETGGQADLTQKKKDKVTPTESKDGKRPQIAKVQFDDNYLVQLVVDILNQEPECPGGWLIVDFPRTKQQAQLLERELSGYEDPKPIKKGDVKKVNAPKEKTVTPTSASLRSRGGPTFSSDNPSSEVNQGTTPVSGLEMVFLFDAANETCLEKFSQRNESEGKPSSSGGGQDDPIKVLQQLQIHLDAFSEEEEGIKEFLSIFKTLQLINANGKSEDIEHEVEKATNELVNNINKTHQETLMKSNEIKSPSDDDINKPRPSSSTHARSSLTPESKLDGMNNRKSERRSSISGSNNDNAESSNRLLSPELGIALINRWAVIESNYTENMKSSFRSLRKLIHDAAFTFYDTKTRFQNFLKKPDVEQKLIETFQKEYNSIDEFLRDDENVKLELHSRVETLRDQLWDIVDRRRDEAEAERTRIGESKWIIDHSYTLSSLFVAMMQAEVDRYFATRQFIIDYHNDLNGQSTADTEKVKFSSVKLPIPGFSAPSVSEMGSIVLPPLDDSITQNQKENNSKNSTKKTDFLLTSKSNDEKGFPDLDISIDYLKSKLESSELSKDNENYPQEALAFLEVEETILLQRVQRLRHRLTIIFKELKTKSVSVYKRLEEWIGSRYKIEVDATKDLTILIKEAIQAEQKLPGLILLSGAKLFQDFGTLVLEPEVEPRSDSPVEKQAGDQFSIAQLRILTKNLKQIAPSGVIGCKLLIDYFLKASVFAGSNDGLPESFIGKEACNIEKAVNALDPFTTGFISWRKFWMIQSKLLPIDFAQLIELKKSLGTSSTTITKLKFFQSVLWFEKGPKPPARQFDRAAKAKQALFEVFMNANEEFEKDDFLLTCCCDEIPRKAIEKAFLVLSTDNDFVLTRPQVLSIFTHFMYPQKPKSSKSVRQIRSNNEPSSRFNDATLQKIFDAAIAKSAHASAVLLSSISPDNSAPLASSATVLTSLPPAPSPPVSVSVAPAASLITVAPLTTPIVPVLVTPALEKISFSLFADGCIKSGNEEWLDFPLYPLDDMATLSRPSSGNQAEMGQSSPDQLQDPSAPSNT